MWKLLPIVVALLSGMLGCEGVEPGDVTGTWVIKAASRDRFPPEFQDALGKIVVNEDGTFVAYELPIYHAVPTSTSFQMQALLFSGSGSWKIASRTQRQNLVLEFADLQSGIDNMRGPYDFPLNFSKVWSAIGLYYSLHDPDSGPKVTFEKEQTSDS